MYKKQQLKFLVFCTYKANHKRHSRGVQQGLVDQVNQFRPTQGEKFENRFFIST